MKHARPFLLSTAFAVTLSVAPALVHAQADDARPAIVNVLLRDVAAVEQKLISLAEAIPEEHFGWRPADGVRSVGEVMVHIAADNWFLPIAVGTPAPEATGIKGGDYPSVQAYEARAMSKTEAIAAVQESFAHLRDAMEGADDAALARTVNLFGTEMPALELWVLTTTHLHEHLGQLIAYARANDVVPPWSR